ncbi:hypothetical protein DL769_009187 [Monosporascus sp. CRB-8-3]|nr:hypothetical protein DL769_009187 [Monosporascus sp. CRB-8-3]
MAPTIHLVRHAEGLHNVWSNGWDIKDPGLTENGEEQCKNLSRTFPYMDKVTHLIASPLRRTIQTCLQSFGPVVARGTQIVLLPELQEFGQETCNVGSEPEKLRLEFGYRVDLELVGKGWYDKGPNGAFAERDREQREARAQNALEWLYSVSESAADDDHIVVVTHGVFVNVMLKDEESLSRRVFWRNAEYRSFRFVDSHDDPTSDAVLIETDERYAKKRWRPNIYGRGNAADTPLSLGKRAVVV